MQKPSSSHVQVVTKQCRESKQVFPKGHRYQVERQKVRDVKMYIKNLPNFSFSVPLGARTQMFFIFCPWILGDFYLNLVDVGEFLFLIAKSVFIITFYNCIHDTLLRLSSQTAFITLLLRKRIREVKRNRVSNSNLLRQREKKNVS